MSEGGPLGLEIGGGNRPFRRDFIQFDAEDYHEETGLVYTTGDARKLPYEDKTFPHVLAFNVLEHFPTDETIAVLTEWARVVETGGWLDLIVPDTVGILNQFFDGKILWKEAAVRIRGTFGLNRHHAAFTLPEFPAVIAQVPILIMKHCQLSNEDCGIHVIAVRVG